MVAGALVVGVVVVGVVVTGAFVVGAAVVVVFLLAVVGVVFFRSCAGGVAKLSLSQTRYLPMGTVTEAKEVYKVPVCLRYPGPKGELRLCKLL